MFVCFFFPWELFLRLIANNYRILCRMVLNEVCIYYLSIINSFKILYFCILCMFWITGVTYPRRKNSNNAEVFKNWLIPYLHPPSSLVLLCIVPGLFLMTKSACTCTLFSLMRIFMDHPEDQSFTFFGAFVYPLYLESKFKIQLFDCI